jgi:hypothetical protein
LFGEDVFAEVGREVLFDVREGVELRRADHCRGLSLLDCDVISL